MSSKHSGQFDKTGRLPVSADSVARLIPLTSKPHVGDALFYDCGKDADPVKLLVTRVEGSILHFTSEYMNSLIIWKFTPTELDPTEFNIYLFREEGCHVA